MQSVSGTIPESPWELYEKKHNWEIWNIPLSLHSRIVQAIWQPMAPLAVTLIIDEFKCQYPQIHQPQEIHTRDTTCNMYGPWWGYDSNICRLQIALSRICRPSNRCIPTTPNNIKRVLFVVGGGDSMLQARWYFREEWSSLFINKNIFFPYSAQINWWVAWKPTHSFSYISPY